MMAVRRVFLILLVLFIGFILGLAASASTRQVATSVVTTTVTKVSTLTLVETFTPPTAYKTVIITSVKTTTVSYGENLPCLGSTLCFKGIVTKVVDGDTIDVNGVRVRLALVNTPERGEPGYTEAREFTSRVCQVGSEAIVDVDDGQPIATDRLIARVICGGVVLNESLLESGHAVIDTRFCNVSEFASEAWAKEHGC